MIEELLPQLPPATAFPDEMPRYPNLWFLVDEERVLRKEYGYCLRFLDRVLDEELALRDSFCDTVRNPALRLKLSEAGEGADFQARIGPVQRFSGPDVPEHAHQLHARFYVTSLIRGRATRAKIHVDGEARACLMVAASIHYEVATEDPLHPYVDPCPICGITGDYALPIDSASQDYCLKIHDPLGLEFLLHGKIRGVMVPDERGNRVRCIDDLREDNDIRIEEASPGPMGCARIACVYFGANG
jgi:hypothetical protein